MNWTDVVAIVLSAVAAGFSIWSFFLERNRNRQEATIRAFEELEKEVFQSEDYQSTPFEIETGYEGAKDMLVAQVDLIQRISVPGYLRLVVVQRGAVLIDNGSDTLVAGHNALDGVGAFDGLHLCDSLQLREDLRVFFLAHASHSFERHNIGSEVHQVCRQQAVIQKGVIESSHTAPAFLHIIIAYYVQKSNPLSQLSAYTSLRYMQIEHPNRQ